MFFVYHFSGVSPECRTLLSRVEQRDIRGVTGAHIILEVTHRMMAVEAICKGLIAPGRPVRKFKEHPGVIKQLTDYNDCSKEIGKLRIRVYSVTEKQIRDGQGFRSRYGMTNDSVIAAMMFNYGVTNLASRDSDLSRIT